MEQIPILFCPTLNQISNANHIIKSYVYKTRLCQKLREGMILEVYNVKQAMMVKTAVVTAIIILELILTGFACITNSSLVEEIQQVVGILIIDRTCIRHFVNVKILETMGVDFIDKSEVLDIIDDQNFIKKHLFGAMLPLSFIYRCQTFDQALQQIMEGVVATSIQGYLFDQGNLSKTMKNVIFVMFDLVAFNLMRNNKIYAFSEKIVKPMDFVSQAKKWRHFLVVVLPPVGS